MKEYKLIVAGGRDFIDVTRGFDAIREIVVEIGHPEIAIDPIPTAIVSGMARGADSIGVQYARTYGWKLYEFPADWNRYGKAAGFIRNEQMGDFADGLLAFWDGQSRGTRHMIEYMRQLKKPVQIIDY